VLTQKSHERVLTVNTNYSLHRGPCLLDLLIKLISLQSKHSSGCFEASRRGQYLEIPPSGLITRAEFVDYKQNHYLPAHGRWEWHAWEDDGPVAQVGCADGQRTSFTKLDSSRHGAKHCHLARAKSLDKLGRLTDRHPIEFWGFQKIALSVSSVSQEISGNPPPTAPSPPQ
jgi:hypothetical protein